MVMSTNIACAPNQNENYLGRHSNDFSIIQMPHNKRLIWHVISNREEPIEFNVKEHHTYKEDSLRFEHIKDGTITEYMPYRNLYVADAKHAKGYFVVRVEEYNE